MLIRHLDYFITLTEERHFGRAADLCGVSQPALSLAIRKLEEDLATPLIIRGQRFMGLTAEGEKLKIWGQRILADYGNLRDDLTGRRRGGLSGLLRLGVVAAAMPLATAISARFEARNPMARISIANLPAEAISRGVSDQSLDGGLTWLAPTRRSGRAAQAEAGNAALIEIALQPQSLRFACRADHPFATGAEIGLRDAMTQPLCLSDDIAEGLQLVMRGGRRKIDAAASGLAEPSPPPGHALPGLAPPGLASPAVRCGTLDAVLGHLRSGLWCALVPDAFANLLSLRDEIRLCPLSGATSWQPGVVLARRELQSPMVRAFEDCVRGLQSEGWAVPAMDAADDLDCCAAIPPRCGL